MFDHEFIEDHDETEFKQIEQELLTAAMKYFDQGERRNTWEKIFNHVITATEFSSQIGKGTISHDAINHSVGA